MGIKAKQIGPTPVLRNAGAVPALNEGPDDPSLPRPHVRASQQRIKGHVVADEVIAAHVERVQKTQARAQTVKREKITPKAKQTHAVENENVHTRNESARQVDAREEIDRDSEVPTSWRPPSRLDAPPPRPGYRNRYIRFRSGSEEDAEHFDEALDEGWRPVKRSRVRSVHELTASTHGKYGQYYVKRGLILMEIPEALEIQRARYFNQQQKDMNRGVDQNLFKLNHRVMPLLKPQRSTRVTQMARRGRLEDAVPGEEAEA
jgi:hypothetical protein